jgi:hypothetical protein
MSSLCIPPRGVGSGVPPLIQPQAIHHGQSGYPSGPRVLDVPVRQKMAVDVTGIERAPEKAITWLSSAAVALDRFTGGSPVGDLDKISRHAICIYVAMSRSNGDTRTLANTNGAIFGQRLTRPPFRVNGTPTHWPFVSKKNPLRRMLPLAGALTIVLLTEILATAANIWSGSSLMPQYGEIQIAVLFVVVVALIVGSRRRVALKIDREGLVFFSGRRIWQYAWPDIERAVVQPNVVRLILKGRTENQNKYNLIPVNLGLNGDQIENLVFFGIKNFSSSRVIPTVAQGDNWRRARSMSLNFSPIALDVTRLGEGLTESA